MAGLRDLHAGSTEEDLQNAVENADQAPQDFKDSGSKLGDVQLDALEDAFGDLKDAIMADSDG